MCLSITAIAAQDLAIWNLSLTWSPRNRIHCKESCYRIIIMHLTRHSGIYKTAWQNPVEQLLLMCLSITAIAAQDLTIWNLSITWSPTNQFHCKESCYRIIIVHLIRHSGIYKTAWQNPVKQLLLMYLSISAIAAQDLAIWNLSIIWSPRNHIHCKESCHRLIMVHLIRHSGI